MKSTVCAVLLALLSLGAPLWATTAQASTLTLEFNDIFPMNDKPDPGGTTPWLTAFFEDVSGGVNLTLTANLTGSQFISNVYFNYKDTLSLPLVWSPSSGIFQGADGYKADGDGWYDIKIDTAAGGDSLDGTESLTFFIAGASADNFSDVSNDTDFPYFAAAHLQGMTPTEAPDGNSYTSTWIYAEEGGGKDQGVIPEPSTVVLLGSGLLGLFYAGRKRTKK